MKDFFKTNKEYNEGISILLMISVWLTSLFVIIMLWIWFFKIDFDPHLDDNAFVLTGIVFISALHAIFNVVVTAMLFIPDVWGNEAGIQSMIEDKLDDLYEG